MSGMNVKDADQSGTDLGALSTSFQAVRQRTVRSKTML